jgi:hypothetical protein
VRSTHKKQEKKNAQDDKKIPKRMK